LVDLYIHLFSLKIEIEMPFTGRTGSDLNWFIFDNPV